MPTFDIDPEEITVFPIEDEYRFSHYFDRTDLFETSYRSVSTLFWAFTPINLQRIHRRISGH